MEGGKGLVENKVANACDVVIPISDTEEVHVPQKKSSNESSSKSLQFSSANIAETELQNGSSASPDTVTWVSASDKPADIPSQLSRRKSASGTDYPSSESRLEDLLEPNDAKLAEEKIPLKNSPTNAVTVSTPEANLKSDVAEAEDEDEEEEEEEEKKGKLRELFDIIEGLGFACLIGLLIASLTVNKLQNRAIWNLKLWKWCVLVLVVFCGRLITKWFMNVLIFLIIKNFKLKNKILYYVSELRTSVRVFLWLASVLLAWSLLFDIGVKRSKETTKILSYITRALASSLVGSLLWLVKTFLVKLLIASRLTKRFFDPIQETMFHEYVLHVLSGPRLETAEEFGSENTDTKPISNENEKPKEEAIHAKKVKKVQKISAWTMKSLINYMRVSEQFIIANQLDESKRKKINSESEAKYVADQIFQNVADAGCDYIGKKQLLRFLIPEEVKLVLEMIQGGAATTVKIRRSDFRKWAVEAYYNRRFLTAVLKYSESPTEELNKLFTGFVIVVIIIVWLLMMGFLATKALVFILSQLVLAAFMFGNTVKNLFEAVIFIFVMHPFDIGDRCIIDGVQLMVEDIRILTTTFLRYDNEMIYYPNSVLATKPISNFNRSPDMHESVEFVVDVSTSADTIKALKSRIKDYVNSKPQHWNPNHLLLVREIENADKIKMGFYVAHTMNFQNYRERNIRRSKLVLQLKRIFEELGINKYHVLPDPRVYRCNAGSAAGSAVSQPAT